MVSKIRKAERMRRILRSIQSRVIATVLMVVIFASTVFAAISTTYNVVIEDGALPPQTITTARSEAMDILAQAQITLGSKDFLDVASFEKGVGGTIKIKRAKDINIDNRGEILHTTVFATTVGEALKEAGVSLNQEDKTNYALGDAVSQGMVIKIHWSFPLTLAVDGKELGLTVANTTVAEALQNAGVQLDADDEVSLPLDAQLTEDTKKIEVLRVSYTEQTVTETIAAPVEKTNSGSLYVGETKVMEKGADGQQVVTYRVKTVNGQVASKTVLSSTVTKQPQTRKVKVGTKVKPRSINFQAGVKVISELKAPSWLELNDNYAPKSYKRVVEGKGTAYSGGGTCSTGRKAMPGHIAVNPKQIPYGSKLWVVSTDGRYVYGYAIAADTGGFAKSGSIITDLYFNTERECYNFGVRNVRIYVLD